MAAKHEIRIKTDDSDFVLIADSEQGKLVIRRESQSGRQESVCSVTLKNPGELKELLDALKRVLSATQSGRAIQSKQLLERPQQIDQEAKTFLPWSRQEDAEITLSYDNGESLDFISKRIKRSVKSIELRLKKLGHIKE